MPQKSLLTVLFLPRLSPSLFAGQAFLHKHNYSIERDTETGTALHLTSHLLKPSLSFPSNENRPWGFLQRGAEGCMMSQVHPSLGQSHWITLVHRHSLWFSASLPETTPSPLLILLLTISSQETVTYSILHIRKLKHREVK